MCVCVCVCVCVCSVYVFGRKFLSVLYIRHQSTTPLPPTPHKQLSTTCSMSAFPIVNYSVIITEATATGGEVEVAKRTYESKQLNLPVDLDLTAELRQDREYQLYVNACISITCRSTSRIPLGKCMCVCVGV